MTLIFNLFILFWLGNPLLYILRTWVYPLGLQKFDHLLKKKKKKKVTFININIKRNIEEWYITITW
jgi:hypothetical protein